MHPISQEKELRKIALPFSFSAYPTLSHPQTLRLLLVKKVSEAWRWGKGKVSDPTVPSLPSTGSGLGQSPP